MFRVIYWSTVAHHSIEWEANVSIISNQVGLHRYEGAGLAYIWSGAGFFTSAAPSPEGSHEMEGLKWDHDSLSEEILIITYPGGFIISTDE